jgi:hypothetical protein
MHLGTGTTGGGGKTDTDVKTRCTAVGNYIKVQSGYPKTNDTEANNTGATTDCVTWYYYWSATEGSSTEINEGAIVNKMSSATDCLCHFDYGTTLAACKITVTPSIADVQGSSSFSTTISVSANGSTWTDYAGVTQVYATVFRYVKVRISATGSGGIARLSTLNIRLDAKLKTITGTLACVSTDSGGTVAYLTDDRTVSGVKEFIDVDAIQLTASGTTPLIAIYDFADAPNPLSFKALLYTTAGARASGTISYTVRGF